MGVVDGVERGHAYFFVDDEGEALAVWRDGNLANGMAAIETAEKVFNLRGSWGGVGILGDGGKVEGGAEDEGRGGEGFARGAQTHGEMVTAETGVRDQRSGTKARGGRRRVKREVGLIISGGVKGWRG